MASGTKILGNNNRKECNSPKVLPLFRNRYRYWLN